MVHLDAPLLASLKRFQARDLATHANGDVCSINFGLLQQPSDVAHQSAAKDCGQQHPCLQSKAAKAKYCCSGGLLVDKSASKLADLLLLWLICFDDTDG